MQPNKIILSTFPQESGFSGRETFLTPILLFNNPPGGFIFPHLPKLYKELSGDAGEKPGEASSQLGASPGQKTAPGKTKKKEKKTLEKRDCNVSVQGHCLV